MARELKFVANLGEILGGELSDVDKVRLFYFDGSLYIAHPDHPVLKLSLDYEYMPKLEIFDGS